MPTLRYRSTCSFCVRVSSISISKSATIFLLIQKFPSFRRCVYSTGGTVKEWQTKVLFHVGNGLGECRLTDIQNR